MASTRAHLLVGVEAGGSQQGLLHDDGGVQARGPHGARREANALRQQRHGQQQEEADDGDAREQVDVVQAPLHAQHRRAADTTLQLFVAWISTILVDAA